MEFASINSCAMLGLQLIPVTVEVHLGNGLPGFTLVGLADTEVKEARERVRCAITHSGLSFPSNRRITVNLAPADLPKDSGRFDLPIALGILAASGQLDLAALQGYRWAGELSLSGDVRPVKGALAMALALQQSGQPGRLVLPPGSAASSALPGGGASPATRAGRRSGRRARATRCATGTGNRRSGWTQLAADWATGHRQVDAGPSFRRPITSPASARDARECGHLELGGPLARKPVGTTPHAQPPSHRHGDGVGGRRFLTAPGGDFSRAPRRVVPG